MTFDNRIFNVNGKGQEALIAALDLAFKQNSDLGTVQGWAAHKDKGLIFLWSVDGKNPSHNKFIVPAGAQEAGIAAFKWLQSEEAKNVPCTGFDSDTDHDGHNGLGWRVYCEDWGHVIDWHSVVAVKPAYLWYGK